MNDYSESSEPEDTAEEANVAKDQDEQVSNLSIDIEYIEIPPDTIVRASK